MLKYVNIVTDHVKFSKAIPCRCVWLSVRVVGCKFGYHALRVGREAVSCLSNIHSLYHTQFSGCV